MSSVLGYSPVCPPCDNEMKTDVILEHMCASEFGKNTNTLNNHIKHTHTHIHTILHSHTELAKSAAHLPLSSSVFWKWSRHERQPRLIYISLKEQPKPHSPEPELYSPIPSASPAGS